jgi:hypothetical protein
MSRSSRFEYNWIVERNILISIFSFISLVLCFFFVFRCLKQGQRNRIGLSQYPTVPPVQQNDYNTNSTEPPPYNWYSESPPPPPYTTK